MNFLNGNLYRYRREFIYLFFIAIITLYPLFKIGLVINDDLRNSLLAYTNSISSYMNTTLKAWEFQGRTNFLASLFYYVPFMFDNFIYFKVVTLLSLLLNVGLVSLFFSKILGNQKVFFLSFLIISISLQNSWEHNPISSFPGFFTLPFSFLVLAFILFDYYIKNQRHIFLYLSLISYALTLYSYEIFILYSPIFLLIAILNSGIKNYKILLKQISPVIGLCIIYLMSYVIFRSIYGGHYDGAQIENNISILNIAKVIWQFSISSLPSYFLFQEKYQYLLLIYNDSVYSAGSLKYFFDIIEVQWIIRALLAAMLFYSLSRTFRVQNIKKYFVVLIIGILYFFLPNVLLAITPLYQVAVLENGQLGMPASYFSLFAFVLVVIAIYSLIYSGLKSKTYKKVLNIIACLLIIFISFSTDITNKYISQYQVMSTYKWKTIDNFLNTDTYKNIPENSVIFAPSLWEYIGSVGIHDSYWSEYFKYKTGKDVQVVRERKELNNTDNVYYLKYNQSPKELNQYITFGKIQKNINSERLYSNEAWLFVFSKYDNYTLIGRQYPSSEKQDETIEITNDKQIIQSGAAFQFNVSNVNFIYSNNLKITDVKSSKLFDLDSLVPIFQSGINIFENN